MSATTLFQIFGSPNNTKVRIALGYLGVPYESVRVDPQDRSRLVEVSGQPLTPTLQHGDVVMFDSSAILRYLDANHGGDKRLFASDAPTLREIEAWERRTRGGGFGAPIGALYGQLFSETKDQAAIDAAVRDFEAQCREAEAALGGNDFLVGNRLTAADCCVAPLLAFGAPPAAFAEKAAGPVLDFFTSRLRVPDDCPGVRAYVERVMAYDA